jgi:CheY-like chemotaxis protein
VDYQLNDRFTGFDWSNTMYLKYKEKCPPTILLTGQPDAENIRALARHALDVSYFLAKNELCAEKLARAIDSTLRNRALVKNTTPLTSILMADDDPDDRLLVADAFLEIRLENPLDFVADGIELLDYLHRRGSYRQLALSPLPGLILLDLNMPRKGGREVLQEIKQDAQLRKIPIVILTTSGAEADLVASYQLGANSFIVKPVTFDKLVQTIRIVTDYWLNSVTLPSAIG